MFGLGELKDRVGAFEGFAEDMSERLGFLRKSVSNLARAGSTMSESCVKILSKVNALEQRVDQLEAFQADAMELFDTIAEGFKAEIEEEEPVVECEGCGCLIREKTAFRAPSEVAECECGDEFVKENYYCRACMGAVTLDKPCCGQDVCDSE